MRILAIALLGIFLVQASCVRKRTMTTADDRGLPSLPEEPKAGSPNAAAPPETRTDYIRYAKQEVEDWRTRLVLLKQRRDAHAHQATEFKRLNEIIDKMEADFKQAEVQVANLQAETDEAYGSYREHFEETL